MAATALLVIDMQNDFCAPGGWIDQLGETLDNTRAAIGPVRSLIGVARAQCVPVLFTRESHRPDLSDLNANKQWRTRAHGLGIGDTGARGRILVRGAWGADILSELDVHDDDVVVDKPGKSAFHATDLEHVLHRAGVTRLVVCGVTTDCCVQSTARDAADLGFAVVVAAEACAAVERMNHDAALAMLARLGGGVCVLSAAAAQALGG